jgi:hypothetical protein
VRRSPLDQACMLREADTAGRKRIRAREVLSYNEIHDSSVKRARVCLHRAILSVWQWRDGQGRCVSAGWEVWCGGVSLGCDR